MIAGLIPLLTLASVTSSAREGESGPAHDRFLAEFPAANNKLEDYYRHLKIYFVRTEYPNGDVCDFEFFRNGNSIRVAELEGAPHQDGTPYNAYVVSDELIFKLHQPTANSPYSVKALGKGSPSDQKSWTNRVLSPSLAALANAPYGALLPGSIQGLISEKSLKIKAVEQLADGAIRVDWDCVSPDILKCRGIFTFLPDQCWAIRDYTIRVVDRKQKMTKQSLPDFCEYGVIEYAGSDNGVPLVRKVEMWAGLGESKNRWFTFDVKDITHEMVPKDQFTLESFSVRTRPAPRQVPIAYYLLALSAISALAVLGLRYIRNRS